MASTKLETSFLLGLLAGALWSAVRVCRHDMRATLRCPAAAHSTKMRRMCSGTARGGRQLEWGGMAGSCIWRSGCSWAPRRTGRCACDARACCPRHCARGLTAGRTSSCTSCTGCTSRCWRPGMRQVRHGHAHGGRRRYGAGRPGGRFVGEGCRTGSPMEKRVAWQPWRRAPVDLGPAHYAPRTVRCVLSIACRALCAVLCACRYCAWCVVHCRAPCATVPLQTPGPHVGHQDPISDTRTPFRTPRPRFGHKDPILDTRGPFRTPRPHFGHRDPI